MRLRIKGRIINFAYAVLIKCAQSVARANDVDIETALSLISLVKPEVYWTRSDLKRIVDKLTDAQDFYYQHKQMLPVYT
ncbi:MAG: hypothetical protein JZD41_07845, partial [Thermoproteus sp.]|nr:hypothetical protein [Thermoproteus sp.]